MKLVFRIILETPAVFDKIGENSPLLGLSTSLKGMVRSNLREFWKISSEDEEKIFGGMNHPGKISFRDILFEGQPEKQVSVGISKDSKSVTDGILISQELVPPHSSLMGEALIDDDITESQLTLIKDSLLSLKLTGIGKTVNRGYGRCRVEFVDLKSIGEVFISYSWEEPEHTDWIIKLANRLTRNGINVIFDKYDLGIGDNIPYFMEKSVERANKVLVILTQKYKEKADERKGGVGYEYSLINADLFGRLASNNKILPILRKGDFDSSIPKILRQFFICDMRSDLSFEKNYSELFSAILGKKPVERPRSIIG
jgi:hypothetical protein